jgi:two-component system response regulator FixJ
MKASLHPTYIVDDEPDVRSAIAFMLEAAGGTTKTFGSGAEFLAAVPALAPGCILLDIRMPGQSGLDLLRILVSSGVNWPVVIMTGHGEVSNAVQAMRGGATDFIEKPFEESLLHSCLGNAARLLDLQVAG